MQESKEKLRDMGHDGILFLEDCGKDDCVRLSGRLDGKKINIHTEVSSRIDEEYIGSAAARKLFFAYKDIAVLSPRASSEYHLRTDKYMKHAEVVNDLIQRRESLVKEFESEQERSEEAKAREQAESSQRNDEESIADLLPR